MESEGEAGCEGRIIISMKGMKSYDKSLKLKQHKSVDSIKSPNKFHQDLNFQAFKHEPSGWQNSTPFQALKTFQIASIHSPLPSCLWHERPLRCAIAPALILCKATIGSSIASAMKTTRTNFFIHIIVPAIKRQKTKKQKSDKIKSLPMWGY